MNIISEDVKDLLVTAGLGVMGSNLFVEFDPDEPDNRIVVMATGGYNPDPHNLYRPTFTVHIYNLTMLSGYSMAESVRDALHEYNNTVLNSTFYAQIRMVGDINPLGKEGRSFKFSINFSCIRHE